MPMTTICISPYIIYVVHMFAVTIHMIMIWELDKYFNLELNEVYVKYFLTLFYIGLQYKNNFTGFHQIFVQFVIVKHQN